MSSPNIKDLLTSFSPSSDFFAIASGDGRIKIWDTMKGQLQTEFANIAAASTDAMGILSNRDGGHLSLDYTCMKWVQLGGKKKKKLVSSLLVLGTGHGDVLSFDVAAGQLKWMLSDCHPGGVSAVSFSRHNSCIYTAGVDGMVCQINSSTGSLLGKFRASTKAISSLSISEDGNILAAASAQLKIFSCSDNKKIQKLSGHMVPVRCMIFSEDGKYILSSAVGEKYIAIWKLDAGKKQSACCVLSMEHPAVFLNCMGSDSEGTESTGLYVLAISETGQCYFWYGSCIDELRISKPTRISLSIESSFSKNKTGLGVFSGKFQGIVRPAAGLMLVAYGSLIKPSFEKLSIQYGIDVNLDASKDGVLLPMGQSNVSQKGQVIQFKVTALDRANAEDAILPLPKLYDHVKKRKHSTPRSTADIDIEMADPVLNNKNKTFSAHKEDNLQKMEEDVMCMEDRLRAIGILGNKEVNAAEKYARRLTNTAPGTNMYNSAQFSIDVNMPAKKQIRSHILSMSPSDSYKLLEILVSTWKTRSADSKHVLTLVYYILVNHGHFIISQDASAPILDALQKMTRFKCAAIQPLLKLSGRLRLIMTQIDKVGQNTVQEPSHHDDASEDEDEDDDDDDEDEGIDELIYGEEEDGSQSGSDDDREQL